MVNLAETFRIIFTRSWSLAVTDGGWCNLGNRDVMVRVPQGRGRRVRGVACTLQS